MQLTIHMTKSKSSLAYKDPAMVELMAQTDHKTLAVWAMACAERVMPHFEDTCPDDPRPRQALEACERWVETGEFSMATIRAASLGAHAAAREVGADNPARSAARAAGQAVATAHVATHAIGAANYARQAVFRAADMGAAEAAVEAELAWQMERLRALNEPAAAAS